MKRKTEKIKHNTTEELNKQRKVTNALERVNAVFPRHGQRRHENGPAPVLPDYSTNAPKTIQTVCLQATDDFQIEDMWLGRVSGRMRLHAALHVW